MRIPLLSQVAEGRSVDANPQRMVNMFVEKTASGRNPTVVFGCPGLVEYADTGESNVRAMLEFRGTGYVVAGTGFYRLNGSTAESLGTVSGSGLAQLACNGVQIGILAGGLLYTYTLATEVFAQVTDPDLPNPIGTIAYADTYGILTEEGTGKVWATDPLDFSSISGLAFATAEAEPDDVVAAIYDHSELLIFGTDTIQPYYNDAGAGFPFSPIPGSVSERGCAAKGSIVREDNTVFFLGNDRVLYRMEGRTPMRISTHELESLLSGMSVVSDCRAWAYTEDGHKFIVFAFPSGGRTLVYDVATQLWHERTTQGEDYWRAVCHMKLGDKHLVGDAFSGKVYRMALDEFEDAGSYIERRMTFSALPDNGKPSKHLRLEIEMEQGTGSYTTDPQMMLSWSDDGGHTYGNEVQRGAGLLGSYGQRPTWWRLGQTKGRGRVYQLRMTDSYKWALTAAFLEVE